MSIVGRVFEIGGHDKSLMGPIPFIGAIERVPDIDVVEERVVRVVVNESRRWGRGLVFFVGLFWVFIVDLRDLRVIVLFHGQHAAT